MKIAYVITGLACGGAESQLAVLANEMAKTSKVKVFSIAENKEMLNRFSDLDVEIIPIKSLSSLLRFFFALKKYSPDVIHSHMIHANMISVVTAFLLNIVCYCTSHNTNEGSKKRVYFATFLYRIFKPKLSHVSAVGINNYKRIYKVKGDIDIYINPIDFSKFNTKGCKQIDKLATWINVASLTNQKRHDRLLYSFNEYLKIYPKDKLSIVGTGENEQQLVDLINELNLNEHVTLLGRRDDIPTLLTASEYFILSSDWEGLPVAVIEALKAGLPVISTNCGDLPEIIRNDVNGILCEHDTKSLTAAMLKIKKLGDNEYQTMSNQATNSVDKFDVKQIATYWRENYISNITAS